MTNNHQIKSANKCCSERTTHGSFSARMARKLGHGRRICLLNKKETKSHLQACYMRRKLKEKCRKKKQYYIVHWPVQPNIEINIQEYLKPIWLGKKYCIHISPTKDMFTWAKMHDKEMEGSQRRMGLQDWSNMWLRRCRNIPALLASLSGI